ncbi:MAG: PEGA domain-containing protein [bacterium]|nr:PEGA domain-containing protein [bacterium]
MPRFIRGIIFSIFAILFVASAAALLLFAGGYRYHWEKRTIEKTGQFIIESKPRAATVRINGQEYWGVLSRFFKNTPLRTPTSIKYLLSGDYQVEIRKEGYHPWRQKLSIMPERSTIVNDLVLLKQEDAKKLVPEKSIRDSIFFEDGKSFFITNDALMGYDVSSGKREILYQARERILSYKISPSRKRFLVKTAEMGVVLEERSSGIQTFELTFLTHDVKKSGWTNTNQLIIGDETGIYRVDYAANSTELLFGPAYTDFLVSDKVYVMTEKGVEKRLIVLEVQQKAINPYDVGALPQESLSFIDAPESSLAVQNMQGGIYLFDRADLKKGYIAFKEASKLSWDQNDSFIAWNDFEIWKYDINKEGLKKELLTRQSEPIRSVSYAKDASFVFFISGKGDVVALETRGGRERNRITLEDFSDVQRLVIAPNKKDLYVIGMKNGEEGLYSLSFTE